MSEKLNTSWQAGADVDLWGPPVTVTEIPDPATPADSVAPARRRKPWGLGDVWMTIALLVLAQVLLIPILFVMAISRLGNTLGDPSTWGPDQIVKVLDTTVALATEPAFLVLALASQWLVFAGYPWLVARRKGLRSLARDFGMRLHAKDVGLGAGLAVALQALMFGFGWVVSQTGLDVSGSDNTSMVTSHHGWVLVLMIAAAAIGAPLTEELLFRGLVFRAALRSFAHVDLAQDPHFAARHQRGLSLSGKEEFSATRRKVGVVLAVLASSLLFGVMHTPMSSETAEVTLAAQILLVFQTGFLGAVFAVVAYKTKRLGVNIVAHVVFNSVSVALALIVAGQ